jgi:TRAP-type C4-dicarboxylate transport system substrate-binding protein
VLDFFDKDPAAKKIIAQFEKDAGVKVLMWTTHTSTHEINGANISTRNKLLRTPADMKGLKLRTYSSPVDMTLFRAWGANPTVVDFAQLYSAVQQGVVDGSSGSTLAAYAAIKLYEVTKYYLVLPFKCFMMPLHMNAKKYNSLTPAQQSVLHEAAKEAMAFNRKDAVEWVSRALVTTKNAGVTMVFPTPDEYAQWTSVRDKVWEDVAAQLKGKIDLDLAKRIKESYGR